MNLLIVESPTKAKTLKKYLGKDFQIMASVGHIKDLPSNKIGVDTEKGFEPEYVTIKGKNKVLTELKKASKKVDTIYLAPDPDREGEAIAWHIAEELKKGKKEILRVLFNEFTSRAIKEALSSPQEINYDRFKSQQARRILDRLVGYQLSPLLWSKVKRGLSAGRVQSVALRLICEREWKIHAFDPVEYWSLTAHLNSDVPPPFKARLLKFDGKKADLKTGEETEAVVSNAKDGPFEIVKVTKRKKKKNPLPPFTTSLMQQEAFKKLRFPAKKTMFLAQNLYEGIELGKQGQVGLITYMRTDSFRLADEAVSEAREYITERFGKEYLPEKANTYKSKKGAQEAHEAIRPTSVKHDPDSIAEYLSKDQLSLYRLIWNRLVASQMTPAILEQTQADIESGKALFRASGSVMVFKGCTVLDQDKSANPEAIGNGENLLPPLKKGQVLELQKLDPAQHFTQPPPRFSEASLIKELEENGIGRPSTYAAILANIRSREYVTVEKGRFTPTELGFLVIGLLIENFPEIVDVAFTAQMETNLDKIERGKVKWTKVLSDFHKPFEKELEKAKAEMKGEIPTDINCPSCDKPLAIKSGRNGLFLACSGYPDCSYTANFKRDEKGKVHIDKDPDVGKEEGTCEKCGKPMIVKNGRYGQFLACSGYPDCKNTLARANGNSKASTNVPCPEEECKGTLTLRTSKKGKQFYGCDKYPDCRFVTWNEPFDKSCPLCGTPVLEIKRPKRSDDYMKCRKKGCKFKEPLAEEKEESGKDGISQ